MGLAGQEDVRPTPGRADSFDADGFIMVVLLIGMAVTAVWMAAALPSWRQQVIREREAELVFRGESIARAIYLYRQKNGQALPSSIDILVSQKYLRKKYKDPITDKDFFVVGGAQVVPGGTGVGTGGAVGRGGAAGGVGPGAGGGQQMQGGIIGVRSTSSDTSIRIYNNQTSYSQWAFDFTLEQLRAGGGAATGQPAGGRGGRQTGPGEANPIPSPRGGGGIGTGPGGGGGRGGGIGPPPFGGGPGGGGAQAPPGGRAGRGQ